MLKWICHLCDTRLMVIGQVWCGSDGKKNHRYNLIKMWFIGFHIYYAWRKCSRKWEYEWDLITEREWWEKMTMKWTKYSIKTTNSKAHARTRNLCFWGCWRVSSSRHGPRVRRWGWDMWWKPYGDIFLLANMLIERRCKWKQTKTQPIYSTLL